MLLELQNLEKERRAAHSAELQREHALEIPAHGHQAPLALDVLEASQEKWAKSHHRFDDAEDRLGRLLAQRIELTARGGFESMRHLLHRRGRGRRGPASGRGTLAPA